MNRSKKSERRCWDRWYRSGAVSTCGLHLEKTAPGRYQARNAEAAPVKVLFAVLERHGFRMPATEGVEAHFGETFPAGLTICGLRRSGNGTNPGISAAPVTLGA